MVIRNPYSFIVKHYKLIHLLLLIPLLYLTLKIGDIANFFRDYVSAGYTTVESGFTETYITGLTYIASIGLLITNILIYAIMATKKKTSYFHLIASIYYIICLIVILFSSGSMRAIESLTMDATFANFVRDTVSITTLPGYVLLIWGFGNAIGFNIKTFRLDGHNDLKVSDEEDDDIEIKVGSDEGHLKRNSVHAIRELKYYVLENKFVFTCLGAVLLLIIGYTWYTTYQVYNKTYSINQDFSLDNFTLSVKDSYITNVDYRGTLISMDKYYLAVKIGIHNQGSDIAIDKSNFRIYIGDEVIYPSYDKSSRFIDIGKMYHGEVIKYDESNDYVFVYELTKKQLKSSYEMRILNGLSQKNEDLLVKYKKINIRPSNVLKTQEIGKTELNKQLDLSSTTLGETTYKLKSLKIVEKYEYQYESCDVKNNCKTIKNLIVPSGGNILVIVQDDLQFDEESPYYKNSERDFYFDFVTIDYAYVMDLFSTDVKHNSSKLVNVTPKILVGKQSIYEAPGTLLYATDINIVIQIRNQVLTIDAK